MVEVRIHGRGGQGSVVLAELLAAAAWEEGKFSQAFPYLGGGGERRGAPVQAFARMSDKRIRTRCRVQAPDYVIVQDVALIGVVDVTRGMREGGLVLLNGDSLPRGLGNCGTGIRLCAVPAGRAAAERTGRALTNTAMLGAFARATGELSLESVLSAVRLKFAGDLRAINEEAVRAGYCAAGPSEEGDGR